jgi:hypothetical protein
MGWPVLRLTPEELRWNDYYDMPDGRRGVLARALTKTITLDAAHLAASTFTVSSRRSRVYAITFSGDVTAAKVNVQSGSGEQYVGVGDFAHIPLLCGGCPHSTLDQGTPFPALYPSAPTLGAVPIVPHAARPTLFEIEPNIVLPGAKQLQFNFALENPTDPSIFGENAVVYQIEFVVHLWEFPKWRGEGN